MTKHVRKEHPTEPIQDDQDAEYSDAEASDDELEDESDEIKEESQHLYEMQVDTKKMHLGRPPSEYSRNLWGLPGQPAHRPSPLHLQSSTIPRSDSVQKIKLERVPSAASQRSLTDPYPNVHMQSSDFSLSRADTMPSSITIPTSVPQPQLNTSIPPQYQLRNTDSLGLWSPQHAIQDSPTSMTHSSPTSASSQSHALLTSQPYQLDIPSHDQLHHLHQQDILLSSRAQHSMDDLSVHEIHLDQSEPQIHRDMASTPVHQNPFDGGIQHFIPHADPYVAMSRQVSQFQDELPSTPASTRHLPHYTTSLAEEPYSDGHYVSIDSFSQSQQLFPPNGGTFQYNDASRNEWWKDDKLAANGFLLPAQRVQEYSWGP